MLARSLAWFLSIHAYTHTVSRLLLYKQITRSLCLSNRSDVPLLDRIERFELKRCEVLQTRVEAFPLERRKELLHHRLHAYIETFVHLENFNSLSRAFTNHILSVKNHQDWNEPASKRASIPTTLTSSLTTASLTSPLEEEEEEDETVVSSAASCFFEPHRENIPSK